ncbi:MAG TPA: lipoprotein-releasing ABC transporter ATP-binding protein LolD [Gammaproteobacteria bacterium]|nr:lipoprotein-releasing ABC transporter ATP-binding protein LolD [Gammaproteobacteria bacterium]
MNKDATNQENVLSCRSLSKTFDDGASKVNVLNAVDLTIKRGERAAIVGASGSGKSTLLHLLGGLDKPTQGDVQVQGQNMHQLDDAARGRLRNQAIGFVYQFHHLLPEFSALENVAMPLLMRRGDVSQARKQAKKLLDRVGLANRLTHKPGELSGGERQRAAVARALITQPAILLADEPTGNLDARAGDVVYELMLELNAEIGTALLVVTHDTTLAAKMDTTYSLQESRLSLS